MSNLIQSEIGFAASEEVNDNNYQNSTEKKIETLQESKNLSTQQYDELMEYFPAEVNEFLLFHARKYHWVGSYTMLAIYIICIIS